MFKHQSKCYRIIKKERYLNIGDTWKSAEDSSINTNKVKTEYKNKGCKVYVQKYDGCWRIFVRVKDLIDKCNYNKEI